MPLMYKPPDDIDKIDYKKEINYELSNGRELNALFLIHGYIEAFLFDWLIVSGNKFKKDFSNDTIKNLERLTFYNLLLIHFILGNIDDAMYNRIKTLNTKRNNLTHEIIIIDVNHEDTKKEIKKIACDGIEICDEIFMLYKKTLDEKQKLVE